MEDIGRELRDEAAEPGGILERALTALPIARLVDHDSRRRILASLVGLWSTATWPPLRPACRPL